MKQKSPYHWVLSVLRYGLLAAALVYLYFNVGWHDYAKLNDSLGTRVRVVDVRYGPEDNGARVIGIVALRDGQSVEYGIDQLALIPDTTEPEIQRGIVTVVRQMRIGWALLALLIFGPVPLMQSMRLVWMLAIQEVRISYWTAVKLSYAGNFFNFALPGTTGGDVIKAYYLTQYTHRKTEVVTTVFLDRIVGLIGVVIVASVMIMIKWKTSNFGNFGRALAIVATVLGVGALIICSSWLRRTLRLRELLEKLPAGHHLIRAGRAAIALDRHRGLFIGSVLITILLQFIAYIAIFAISRALDMDGEFLHYLVFLPIGFMIAAIPISPPQAFGVLEWAYIQFFTAPGGLANMPSQAVALALGVRLMQLTWALPGVLVPLLGAHLPRADELAELEDVEVGADVPAEPADSGTSP